MIVFKKFQKEKFNKFLVDLKPLENKSEAYAQNISHTYGRKNGYLALSICCKRNA